LSEFRYDLVPCAFRSQSEFFHLLDKLAFSPSLGWLRFFLDDLFVRDGKDRALVKIGQMSLLRLRIRIVKAPASV
jgi:hypothetical protein